MTWTGQRLKVGTALLGVTLGVAACGSSGGGSSGSSSSSGSSQAHVSIALFGYSKANSFTNASNQYISDYAAAHNADVTFFDGNFDGNTQLSQIQDATATGKYQVFIVEANETTAIVAPLKQAVAKGIAVVALFGPIGSRFDTKEPQIDGTFAVLDVPTATGKDLGQLGLKACESFPKPCKVAYTVANKAQTLDIARTKAAVDTLTAGGATVWDTYESGYTAEGGRKAGQDLFQAHPDVNVIVTASSQALAGIQAVIPSSLQGKVKLIGNGGSEQAVQAVLNGAWFATYYIPWKAESIKAAEMGIAKARGQTVSPTGYSSEDLGNTLGTKDVLSANNLTGDYKDD